jgi:hypothetical protein
VHDASSSLLVQLLPELSYLPSLRVRRNHLSTLPHTTAQTRTGNVRGQQESVSTAISTPPLVRTITTHHDHRSTRGVASETPNHHDGVVFSDSPKPLCNSTSVPMLSMSSTQTIRAIARLTRATVPRYGLSRWQSTA